MNNQILVIHETMTEEILGMITPDVVIDFSRFVDEVWITWKSFNFKGKAKESFENNGDILEDFIEYHNKLSEVLIQSVVSDFIQL